VLIRDDKDIVYIGRYQTGIVKRWCRGKRKDIIHFKESRIRPLLKQHKFRVFAQDEQNIKRQIGQPNNKWINYESIESRLIDIHKPEWNERGNQKIKSTQDCRQPASPSATLRFDFMD